MTTDNPQPAPSAYAYVPMTDAKPLFIPVAMGGTGNPLDYLPGLPPIPVTEAAKAAERTRKEP